MDLHGVDQVGLDSYDTFPTTKPLHQRMYTKLAMYFGDQARPPIATTAWCVIGVLSEEFRRNQDHGNATWIVEHWTYTIDGDYVADVTNNFIREVSAGTLSSCSKSDNALPATRMNLAYTAR